VAIQILSNNQYNHQFATDALMTAQDLSCHSWIFFPIWTPSHTNIPGNNQANLLAKEGAQLPIPYCCTITLAAWLQAEVYQLFLNNWIVGFSECRLSF
jgi:hypothetical protein